MDVRLDDKIMLVTGASTGIGRAIAEQAARSGAAVAINYLSSQSEAESLKAQIDEERGTCCLVKGDVSDEEEVLRIFSETAEKLGRAPDCLVNNAGSMIGRSPIAEMETAVWDRVYAVNMRSVFLCCRRALKTMIPNRSGVIINISSIGAYTGGGPGSTAYASTKGAMNTFTMGLAREVAPYNIRVMAVGPGVIETPFHDKFTTPERRGAFEKMIPLGRVGRPEDIAPMVILLASDLSSFTTAHHFDITGGM
ncbi:MAG: glucose 1-dehydrogenase [Deltaproteobacteria bacterium]|nr:glucose 1-dehydrogenase [Candidatus Zymogenaceae bacterium]